jgi:hypothetical protein
MEQQGAKGMHRELMFMSASQTHLAAFVAKKWGQFESTPYSTICKKVENGRKYE